jgi:hypothetical protein
MVGSIDDARAKGEKILADLGMSFYNASAKYANNSSEKDK